MSHVESCRTALADMVRVLRPGGKVGITAWGARSDEFRDYWDALVGRAADPEALRSAVARATPWEAWLAQPANVRAALVEAGLRDVTVEEIDYPVHLTIADFLATVCKLLGIDYTKENHPPGINRPVRIVDKDEKPIEEVFA